jgi:hypothetical protein
LCCSKQNKKQLSLFPESRFPSSLVLHDLSANVLTEWAADERDERGRKEDREERRRRRRRRRRSRSRSRRRSKRRRRIRRRRSRR